MAERIPVDIEIPAYWARTRADLTALQLPNPLVAILADYDKWNDYGLRFLAHLLIVDSNGQALQLPLRTMVSGYPITSTFIDELLGRAGSAVPIDQPGVKFVSQLSTQDHYHSVIKALGFAYGVAALRAIGDAVIVKLEGLDQDRLDLINSEDFHVGVLRNNLSYEAAQKGGRFIRPSDYPDVIDAAVSFHLELKLPTADNPYRIDFDFEEDKIFQDRIAVLIGRNGTGKSQSLRTLISYLTEGGLDNDIAENVNLHPLPDVSRVLVFSSVSSDGYPRTISPWRGIDYAYYSITASSSGSDSLLAAIVASIRDTTASFEIDGEMLSRRAILQQAIKAMGIWDQLHLPLVSQPKNDRLGGVEIEDFRYFPVRQSLDELGRIQLGQQIDWSREIALFDENQRKRQLSSGEFAMLRFSAQATLAVEQGSLLLLDEPETHLHPNFISDFIEILHGLLSATGSVAIIATHSAYVVREVPRRRVRIISIKDRSVYVDTPRLQTFGANADSISQFIFGDTLLAHRYQKALEAWVRAECLSLTIDEIIERYGSELNLESLSYISRFLERYKEAPT